MEVVDVNDSVVVLKFVVEKVVEEFEGGMGNVDVERFINGGRG